MIINLLLWILCVFGVTFLITESKACSFIRNPLVRYSFFSDLFDCYFCMGIWVSTINVFICPPTPLKLSYFLIFGGATGSYFFHKLLVLIEAKTRKIITELYPDRKD